jgi:hypothetical protein
LGSCLGQTCNGMFILPLAGIIEGIVDSMGRQDIEYCRRAR